MRVSDFLVKIRKILLNKVISPRLFPLAYVHSVYTETLKHSSRILVGPISNFSLDLGSGGSKAAPEGCQIWQFNLSPKNEPSYCAATARALLSVDVAVLPWICACSRDRKRVWPERLRLRRQPGPRRHIIGVIRHQRSEAAAGPMGIQLLTTTTPTRRIMMPQFWRICRRCCCPSNSLQHWFCNWKCTV